MAGVSIHALTVSDNPKKFAIAVTRARVDSPSFLVVIPSCCALHASPGCAAVLEFRSKPGARGRNSKGIRSLAWPGSRCCPIKSTRFRWIFHVVF